MPQRSGLTNEKGLDCFLFHPFHSSLATSAKGAPHLTTHLPRIQIDSTFADSFALPLGRVVGHHLADLHSPRALVLPRPRVHVQVHVILVRVMTVDAVEAAKTLGGELGGFHGVHYFGGSGDKHWVFITLISSKMQHAPTLSHCGKCSKSKGRLSSPNFPNRTF